ncbi:hypothetical protein [Mucilaginibacter sp. MD40]|uniref:hypothetical protein n=1 Tax=Mucilaginibacter sp. MD40 TaxID=2029590 RepID=UPI00117F994A|nr:hypothetical protein [Mucilaginibacter sp. MD40]
MRKSSYWMMILGAVIMIAGCLIFRNLNHINAVDSHNWTINVNGILSFPWLTYTGFIIFMVGACFYIGTMEQRSLYGKKLY